MKTVEVKNIQQYAQEGKYIAKVWYRLSLTSWIEQAREGDFVVTYLYERHFQVVIKDSTKVLSYRSVSLPYSASVSAWAITLDLLELGTGDTLEAIQVMVNSLLTENLSNEKITQTVPQKGKEYLPRTGDLFDAREQS